MSLNDFKRGYNAGGDASRNKARGWSYWLIFLLALVLTQVAGRRFGLQWYSTIGVGIFFCLCVIGSCNADEKALLEVAV